MSENSTRLSQNRWSMNIFNQYSSHSTITGIQYLTEPKRPWIERCFWVLMFLAMTGTCLILTWDSYFKWKDSPIMISSENQYSSVSDIPFPAITICPYKKFDMLKKNMTEHLLRLNKKSINITDDDKILLEVVSQICLSHSTIHSYFDSLNSDQFISKLVELKPYFLGLFEYCIWGRKIENCNEILKPIFSEKGICYTFNSLNSSKIYKKESNPQQYLLNNYHHIMYLDKTIDKLDTLYKGEGSGKKSGLEVSMINRISDNCEICQFNRQGADVIVHSPYEIPDLEDSTLISGKEDLSVSITPRVIDISDGLKTVDISKRQCYLKDEKYLQHFQIYTQSNCELECLTNLTLKECGCVLFNMPRNKTTNICGSLKYVCSVFTSLELSRMALESKGLKCDCLPSCSSISYNIETSEMEPLYTSSLPDNIKNIHKTKLKFYFKENNFFSWKRYESYGTSDFLASIGGILGLFLGISIMSITEIIYFFTVRLYTNYFGRRNQ